jgi:hypothetical protein
MNRVAPVVLQSDGKLDVEVFKRCNFGSSHNLWYLIDSLNKTAKPPPQRFPPLLNSHGLWISKKPIGQIAFKSVST